MGEKTRGKLAIIGGAENKQDNCEILAIKKSVRNMFRFLGDSSVYEQCVSDVRRFSGANSCGSKLEKVVR